METTRPITHNVVGRPDWASRVSNRYHEMLEEERSENAIQKLSLLKRAIRLTSDTMAKELAKHYVESTDDKLGATMSFVRAVEAGSITTISRCITRYPHLCSLVDNPYDPGLAHKGGLAMR